MAAYICQTCGVQYAERSSPPAHCAICDDERQYVGADGQRWTTLPELRAIHANAIVEVEPGLFRVGTIPEFAIGQHAFLVRTAEGNVLWDCTSLIDEATERAIHELGGVAAIAISHPHFYGSCVEWSRSFDAPIFLPEADRSFVMRPDPAIRFYDRSPDIAVPGVLVTRVGGHFAGSAILHWAGADGQGVVLSGDSIAVGADRASVTFMYSYPNGIPLSAQDVRDLAGRATEVGPFDRLYSAWPSAAIASGAQAAVQRSAERYIGMLEGTWQRRP